MGKSRGGDGESGQPPRDDLALSVQRQVQASDAYRESVEDTTALHAVLDDLVALRVARGISQKEVADRMGVRQPTISQFETESSDPRVSTLQRYARAVGVQVQISALAGSERAEPVTDFDPRYDDFEFRTKGWRAELVIAKEDLVAAQRRLIQVHKDIETCEQRIADAESIIARRELGIDT